MSYYELDKKQLLGLHRYYEFTKWLVENEWQPYWIGNEIYINLELPGRPIRNINRLYDEYCKSLSREGEDYTESTDPRQEVWQ